MANWEFFDNQTPESTKQLVDDLRAGKQVVPTRGPSRVCTFTEVSRVLAGFHDGLADEGVGAAGPSLEGLRVAHGRGWTAPDGGPRKAEHQPEATSNETAAGRHTSTDTPGNAPDEQAGAKPADSTDGTDGK
jgi:NADH-quinone oxidoreductase subunit E